MKKAVNCTLLYIAIDATLHGTGEGRFWCLVVGTRLQTGAQCFYLLKLEILLKLSFFLSTELIGSKIFITTFLIFANSHLNFLTLLW